MTRSKIREGEGGGFFFFVYLASVQFYPVIVSLRLRHFNLSYAF